MRIKLPKGLRIITIDNDNLTCPVGTKATILWENEYIDTRSHSNGVMVMIDGETMGCMLPFEQCEIITDNFKKAS